MYKQRGVHVQLESSKYTIREQCMYNQKAVSVLYNQIAYIYNQRAVLVHPESSTCTTTEQYM
jgi:hypothetical protein